MSNQDDYEKLLAEIATLQAKADEIRAGKRAEAIQTVNRLVAQFEIKSREVRFRMAQPTKAAVSDGRSTVAPRYADGQGNTWSGRGKQPRWLRDGLAGGRTIESYAL